MTSNTPPARIWVHTWREDRQGKWTKGGWSDARREGHQEYHSDAAVQQLVEALAGIQAIRGTSGDLDYWLGVAIHKADCGLDAFRNAGTCSDG